jgi:hypothetical protein
VTGFWKIIASFILPVYIGDAERQSLAAVAFRLPAGSRARPRQWDAAGHDAHDGTSRLTDLLGQDTIRPGRGEAIALIGRRLTHPVAEIGGLITHTVVTPATAPTAARCPRGRHRDPRQRRRLT